MVMIDRFTRHTITGLLAGLMLSGCASGGGAWNSDSGIRASDPHLVGSRDLNYDHLIVPGVRIGPVWLGGRVSDAVQHLGEPDHVSRSTFRGGPYNADEVYYSYRDECITFVWIDTGVTPTVETGWRGIMVTCDKWSTVDGLHVGMPVSDVISRLGPYCDHNTGNGSVMVETKQGIWVAAPDRNSAVTAIYVMPKESTWQGCTN